MTTTDALGGQEHVRSSLRDRMRDMEEKQWGLRQGAAAFSAFGFQLEERQSEGLEAHALMVELIRRPASRIRIAILALVAIVAIVLAATSDFASGSAFAALVLLLVVAFALYRQFHRRREEIHLRADVEFATFVEQLEPNARVLSIDENDRALAERSHGPFSQLRRFLLGYSPGAERAVAFVDDFANVVVLEDRLAQDLANEAGAIDETVDAALDATLTYFPWRLRVFERSGPRGFSASQHHGSGVGQPPKPGLSAQIQAQRHAPGTNLQETDEEDTERKMQ